MRWHLYRGRQHTRTSCLYYATSSPTVDRRYGPSTLRGGSRRVSVGCYWLSLAVSPDWVKLARDWYGFAASRVASTISTQQTCSSGLWRDCCAVFDEDNALVASAVFIVVANWRQKKRARRLWVSPTLRCRRTCRVSDLLEGLITNSAE